MKNRTGRHRAASERAFVSAHSSGFGAFSSASRGSTLSYLSEPPDFSSISDPNVIISLKNLLKKDATTKAKALEDLVAYVEAHPYEKAGGTEEPILEAWAQLYPRISIDNSRRVRELSHTLQCELLKSARKRMERHMPNVVASWLAGTFDRDRGVARVATEGLASILSTPEKVAQFWRRCQQQILEYALEAIRETADTLSDERSTSSDDAEAKYYRVVGGSLALVLNLLQKLQASDIEKHRDDYDKFFKEDKVWNSAVSSDATVRKISCQLVLACLEQRPDIIEGDLSRFSKVFVGEGLKSNQKGSTFDYIRTLSALTSKFPTIWTSNYKGKKSPSSRLRTFLEKGSQGSNAAFWELLSRLIVILPKEVVPNDLEGSLEFMSALRLGATGREEPRSNAVYAWSCYLSVAGQLLKGIEPAQSQVKFAQETIFPFTEQYLFPVPERTSWVSGSQVSILMKAYTITARKIIAEVSEATRQEWIRYKEAFNNRMRASLPEASKDHERSQKSIADEGSRWFALAGKLLELAGSTANAEYPVPDLLTGLSLELLTEGLQLLRTRNWKPFGVAATFESGLKNCPALFEVQVADASSLLNSLNAAVSDSKEAFLNSPSAPYILSSITLLGTIPGREQDFKRLWRTSSELALSFPQSSGALPALEKLISSKQVAALARLDPQLQAELVQRCVIYATNDDSSQWPIFHSTISFDALSEDSATELTGKLVGLLMQRQAGVVPHGTVKALMFIAQERPDILTRDQVIHTSIMTSLLSLSEQSEDSDLTTLRVLLDHPAAGKFNMLEILQKNINDVESNSLGIDTLVDQAVRIRDTAEETGGSALDLGSLLPDLVIWRRELSTLLNTNPNPSLSITSSLGGLYFLVAPEPHMSERHIKRDRNGCSIAGRMARYTSMLLSRGLDISSIPRSKRVDLMFCLSVTAEVATDQVTALDDDQLWKTLAQENSISDAQSLTSASRSALTTLTRDAAEWRDGSGSEQSGFLHDMIHRLLSETTSMTPLGLYSARVMSELLETLAERHGLPSSAEVWLTKLDVLKSTPATILPAVAVLTGLGDNLSVSKTVSNLCNRLVSDVAGAKLESENSLTTLVLLNACMQVYEIGELPVANNRLVFAVRQITAWLEEPSSIDYRYAAEICRSLQYLLPCIKDVYGSYWERAVDFCTYLWTKTTSEPLDRRLSYIHASLKLSNSLQTIRDPNDDLLDVLQSTAERRSSALIELLKLPRDKSSQPLDIVDAIICRQVESIPLQHVTDISDLYSLVASESKTIQTAAFSVLHRALPAAQEQLSVDVLLDKKTAQLPEELLSLLLDAPTLDAYSDEALSRFPVSIRCYLLSWLLVFDAFRGAAHKVRSDYAENLKTENYIGPLMDFTFDVLGHSAAHAIDLDKANFDAQHIHDYFLRLADAETDERNMQWLLIHLFYLVLKYVPLLFKSWFLDCRSKQTKIAVENWMAKYFSPLIISEALDEVETWGKTQEPPAEDEKELIVTVSKPAREITAGYEVDELYASIDIRIPQAYPLENVEVVSKQRVGVNEKKWQSWILTTKGVITFSGGSIVDGLAAFRRNMVGAMKGQTECAICYSIVSTDKRMPDKQCQTCKNLFHRTCLYKWFQTSNQNTCPLCRNPIDYLGVDTRGRRTA